jgi:hypothetical protein
MAKIIRVDGSEEDLKVTNKRTGLDLKTMQTAVGGYIEMVYLPGGRLFVCDEEGKLKGKPVNVRATKMWGEIIGTATLDTLVGDVILAERGEVK